MFSYEQLNEMFRQAMEQFAEQGQSKADSVGDCKGVSKGDSKGDSSTEANLQGISLIQPHMLVIAGLLAGVLHVNYVLINRDQAVQILVDGTLKKSSMDAMLYQVKSMSFDDLVKMMSGR